MTEHSYVLLRAETVFAMSYHIRGYSPSSPMRLAIARNHNQFEFGMTIQIPAELPPTKRYWTAVQQYPRGDCGDYGIASGLTTISEWRKVVDFIEERNVCPESLLGLILCMRHKDEDVRFAPRVIVPGDMR